MPGRFVLLIIWLSGVYHIQAQIDTLSSALPIVVIEVPGAQIPDEPKVPGQIYIIDNGAEQINRSSDTVFAFVGSIGIELRGSSSKFYAKKPYSIEIRDEKGDDLAVSLLGMPDESDWGLIAPLNDKTLMRDQLAHHYARQILPWSPRGRYCELFINNKYQGVYWLIELIKRDKNRVDIKKLDAEDVSGDKLTGGYILRIDKYGPQGGIGGDWPSTYFSAQNTGFPMYFQHVYPKLADLSSEQISYIRDYLAAFESMMARQDFNQHYSEWLDVQTWVDYALVQELVKNTDGYRLSAYFYKDRESRDNKLKMGPVWDFNISMGIGDYCDGQSFTGWAKDFNSVCPIDPFQIHFWWAKLWGEKRFVSLLKQRWQELRTGIWTDQHLLAPIDSFQLLLSEPQKRNFARWPVLGVYVWPNAYIGPTFEAEVNYLKDWLVKRANWLDQAFELLDYERPFFYPVDKAILLAPNPASSQLTITNLQEDGINEVQIYNQIGQMISCPIRSEENQKTIDVNNLASGVYFVQIRFGNYHRTLRKVMVMP